MVSLEEVKSDNAFKPRTLNEARALFSKQEADTLDIVLQQINRDDDDPLNLNYVINLEDYKNKFGLKYDRNAYNKIRKNLKGTGFKDIGLLQEDGTFLEFVLFQSLKWSADGTQVTVKLGEDFKAKLVELKESKNGGITYYSISYTLPMKSQYSKRLYPMLLEFKKTGWRRDNIDTLRTKLQIPDSYKYNDIKRFVLERAVEDINELTELNISYVEEYKSSKGGRKVSSIKWNIKEKVSEEDTIDKEKMESFKYLIIGLTAGKIEITEDEAEILATDACRCGLSTVDLKQRVSAVLKKSSVNNFMGYARTLIKNYSPAKLYEGEADSHEQRQYDWDKLMEELTDNL